MKFKIREIDEGKKEENEIEFWLNEDENGDITLMAQSSKDARPGKILWICKEGLLNRYLALNNVTGISYNDEGKIVLDR